MKNLAIETLNNCTVIVIRNSRAMIFLSFLFQDGQESCCKFLTSRYSELNKNLLRQSYNCNDEVIEWITER